MAADAVGGILPTEKEYAAPPKTGDEEPPKPPIVARVRSWFCSQLPARKTVVRAFLCTLLAGLPLLFVLTLTFWYVMVPVWACVLAATLQYGLPADVKKQLRWFSRMSMRGPIPGFVRLVRRYYLRAKRKYYGAALDVQPLAPAVVGPSVRHTHAVMLKWLVKPTSETSTEKYELQIKPAGAGEADWVVAAAALDELKFAAGSLTPDTEYAVRVRAHNSKGQSEWCGATFRTKQEPVDGGGRGPGYTWAQRGKKGEELAVSVPLPAGTRAKQLAVSVKPTSLSIALQGATLVEGELFGPVKHEDIEWELGDAGDGKELKLTLLKTSTEAPFWPCLVKGHPEVETSGMKKEAMSTEELMAQLQEMGMGGMGQGAMEEMVTKQMGK